MTQTKPYRERTVVPRGEALREQLKAWAERVDLDALGQAEPPMPDELSDRAKDIWEPLFAIAEHAGGTWPDRARRAALSLSAGVDLDSQDEAIQMLAAIKAIFDKDPAKDAVTSAELAEKLSQRPRIPLDQMAGRTRRHLKNSAQSHLARELKPFGIKSRDIRTKESGIRKGYRREQFQDDWERLLDPHQARQPRQPRQPSNHAESSTPGTRDTNPLSRMAKTPKTQQPCGMSRASRQTTPAPAARTRGEQAAPPTHRAPAGHPCATRHGGTVPPQHTPHGLPACLGAPAAKRDRGA